ncbi:tripartite tricarboxylate transporter permease, partial [Accumulibacter sp.]|uniref:tripartite tricarboxylate transporter permease n=1 Tax=Accumulibacter sp. TaxID=2053492 RepID=UPI0035B33523
MELLDNLAIGFGTALTLQNLFCAFAGCLIGTLIGVLPGVGPVATLAILLPTTYALEPTSALIMLLRPALFETLRRELFRGETRGKSHAVAERIFPGSSVGQVAYRDRGS